MSRHPITLRNLVLDLPGSDAVAAVLDVPYGGSAGTPLRMDVYRPAAPQTEPLPAVIFVTGYSDAGAAAQLGCSLKEWAAYVGWARLVAARGMIAVTYEAHDPAPDTRALLEHVEAHAGALGIDPARVGVWSCSGNVPNAFSLIQESSRIACAALLYGYVVDLDGHDEVARAAAQFGFVVPSSTTFETLRDTPMLVVRAGRDEMPGLNASLDRFIARALAANAPLTVINYADGPHAFDVFDDSERSRDAMRQVLSFFQHHLLAGGD